MFTVWWLPSPISGQQAGTESRHGGTRQPVGATIPPQAANVTPWPQGDNVNAAPLPQPGKLIVDAVKTLEACRCVSAKILYEVCLYDKHLIGSGTYLGQWKDADYLLRMELRIQLGDRTSSLVQVCDGPFLWTRRKLPGSDKLTRLDVARAKAGLQRSREMGIPGEMGILPGMGGLPKVFRGLQRNFEFTTAKRGTWGQLKQPVWKLQGQWKRRALIKVLPDQKAALEADQPVDLRRLPQHLPDQVVVFLLARDDPFPYRVEYRRTLPRSRGSDAAKSRPVVTMELSDIDINLPIDPERFVYNPGGLQFFDETNKFLKSLRAR